MKYSRKAFKFFFRGVNLVNPIDIIGEGLYAIATNIRSYFDGVIQSRPGFTHVADSNSSNGIGIQFIKRLNDPIADTFNYIVSSSSEIAAGSSDPLALIGTGFTANKPQTSVIISPRSTPRPWLYIGDRTKLGKTKVGLGSIYNWGIPAPSKAPSISFGVPAYTTINDMEATTNWAAGGTAGTLSNPNRVSTTITRIAYDSGSNGWASVQPAATTDINEGMFLIFNASETAIVDMVLPAIPTTTVAAISYDSGTTGLCSIQLTANVSRKHIRKGTLIVIDSEAVVVIDVIFGADGIPSIRCSTSINHIAGETVTGVDAFRVYLAGTFAATNTLTSKMLQSSIATGIGYLTYTANIDASLASSRPIDMEDDEVHISIKISDLSKLIEIKVYFDVDASTNDFTKNYYFKAIAPNDFVDVTKDTATVLESRIAQLQKRLIKAVQNGNFARAENLRTKIANAQAKLDKIYDTPIEDYTTLGDSQWSEIRFKTKELFRVGSDLSKTLKNIKAARVQVNCEEGLTLNIDSWWIGGTFGPDVGDRGQSYRYMYRYKNKETGARSAWSPPVRSGLDAHRQRIIVATTSSADSQVDLVEIARIGGVVNVWKLIGTTTNGGSYNDDLADFFVDSMESVDLNSFQPFAISDLPKTGVCNIRGTTIDRVSGDTFNTNWARNSIIYVNNQLYTLYGPSLSTGKLEINQNGGSVTNADFYLPSPLLTGQPLASVFGPIGYGESGLFVFALGNSNNPGTLFWTNGNDPDLMRSTNSLEICSPSEVLINGCVWNDRAWCFSNERMFSITPSFSSDSMFAVDEVPNSKGMLGLTQNTAITTGPKIWFRGKDGIYETTGGEPTNITDKLLYNLFPHDGQVGVTVNGYNPPDDTKIQNLEYYDGMLYYDYTDTSGNFVTMVIDTRTYAVSFDISDSVDQLVHYGEEGLHSLLAGGLDSSGNATLFRRSGTSDDGTAIAGTVETGAFDGGDIRAKKQFGDTILDADANGGTLNIVVGFDRNLTTESLENNQTKTGNGRSQKILDIQSGLGKLAFTENLKITWSSNSVVPKLYAWEPAYIIKPEDTTIVVTDPDDLGTIHAKFVQGFRIHTNTYNQNKTITIQSDTGTNGAWVDQQSFTLNSNGESVQAFSFDTPFITHLIRIKNSDSDPWQLFSYEFEYNIEPELVEEYETQQTSNGLEGYQHISFLQITHMSTANLSLTLKIDGVSQTSITIAHSGGLRKKSFVRIPAIKYKVIEYKITSSSPFRLYKSDCEVRCKQWNSSGPYVIIKPFGEAHFDKGAII